MTRRAFDRRALFSSGAAAALLAAAGVSAGPLPQRGGKLRLALSGATRGDDWVLGNGLFMQVARQGLVFETLTEVAADGTLRGELSTDWSSTLDAQVWTFDLRQNVHFHDGVSFSAADVIHSLSAVGKIEAVGADQVRITLAEPDPSLPFRLSKASHVIRAAHSPNDGVGTGIYHVRHFSAGQQLLAERVETHWKDGQAGWFDSVELVSIPSSPVRAQAVAEYLVDGADVEDAGALTGFDDIAVFDGQAVSRSVAMPSVLGRGVFDDMRAPQRWWGA
jgi:ABC-type transport system substrate-binding protein